MRKGATTGGGRDSGGNCIVALRNEKGSYNTITGEIGKVAIVALRNEKGAIQIKKHHLNR